METRACTERATAGDPLGDVAARHIQERLNAALAIARNDLPGHAERFRELLAQAVAQTEAWLLTRDAQREAPAEQPVSRLARRRLLTADARPVDEFLLIPFGDVKVERPLSGGDFVFTRAQAEAVQRWFAQIGRKLAIDYEHQSFERYNSRADGLRPAAGWIGRLELRDDGLWACDVTWTARAQELLRSGEYRYFSPVIYWTNEDHSDVAALGPVALTNDPALRGVQPLAAARGPLSEASTAGNRIAEPPAVEEADSAEPESGAILRAEIEALNQEIEMLRRQMAAQEADAFVEHGMRLGKIVDSTSLDWRDDFLRDAQQTQARLERAPVLLPPGRIVHVAGRGASTSGTDAPAARTRKAGTLSADGVEAEDLAAYERALAAGRVVRIAAPRAT